VSAVKRTALAAIVVAAYLLVFAASASAATFCGPHADRAHVSAARNAIDNNPRLLAAVESVWPDYYVNISHGGQAWLGHIDTNGCLMGFAFTDQVIHEHMHELQRACDAPGGYGSLGAAWLAFLNARGIPYGTTATAWHWLVENLSAAFYGPYYAENDSAAQCSVGKADLIRLLSSVGVRP
jgi:hypothetical protein